MPTTITARSMDDLTWDEVDTALSALRTVPGAEPAVAALEAFQADDLGHHIHSAERRCEVLVASSMSAQQAQALTDALVRIGRALAFRQIAFRLDGYSVPSGGYV